MIEVSNLAHSRWLALQQQGRNLTVHVTQLLDSQRLDLLKADPGNAMYKRTDVLIIAFSLTHKVKGVYQTARTLNLPGGGSPQAILDIFLQEVRLDDVDTWLATP